MDQPYDLKLAGDACAKLYRCDLDLEQSNGSIGILHYGVIIT